MDQVTLGRTKLTVSAAGLGCGGHSRLGQGSGASTADSIRVVEEAIGLGVTFIDTAAVYRTEAIVGAAIKGKRDDVVLSTKAQITRQGGGRPGEDFLTGDELERALDKSLQRLGTDRVDIFHLHGVTASQYDYCRAELVPALIRFRQAGKVRFFGLTERFISDPRHAMLELAVHDDEWDVLMVGYNMINPSAASLVFPHTLANDVGILCMFAVRRILRDPAGLREAVAKLIESGEVERARVDIDDPLGFVTGQPDGPSLIETAYRFCHHQRGTDVVLTGTGNLDHLRQNIAAINGAPLAPDILEQLAARFGRVRSFSGN